MADKLKAVTRTQGANQALKDGTVVPRTFEFDFEEVPVLVHAFRRMVRENAYDITEMALTTYLCAKAHGKPFTALPVFLVRGFHHGAVLYNTKAGIDAPKDLEGKRVGVNRGYTVTTGVWARAILQEEHGVDLDKVTWVLSGDEHVEEYQAPSNVVPVDEGKTIEDMLAAGELAAAIGVKSDHPDVQPLIPDADDAAEQSLRSRGLYPINHLVVVKDELLHARPELAEDVFTAFAKAKEVYLDRLQSGAITEPDATDRLNLRVAKIIGDPLPYGIEPNRQMLEELIDHAVRQGILPAHPKVEEVFAEGSRSLQA